MTRSGLSFHHPVAFWTGCALITAGVLSHAPMLWMARYTDWEMVGMPMDGWMLAGMAAIPLGLLLAAHGMVPRLPARIVATSGIGFHVADGVALNREHWKLVSVLIIALAVDVMKPATLGFVLPGLSAEYAISKPTGSLLALIALTGTTMGSLIWGRMADACGRRAAILLSALMFIGTAICGAMPAFGWNLLMCFLMGLSAGGLLPIAFTLMAETVPAAHRGWLLVLLGGIGTTAGYLLAAGAAAWLEPLFSWRALWLLGLPTGALIIVLQRAIPESPRFLAGRGMVAEARATLVRFAPRIDVDEPGRSALLDEQHPVEGLRALLHGRQARITFGLITTGLAWGLVNFGFLLWLPANLGVLGVDASGASALLAHSALIAIPGIALVVAMYHWYSSVRSLVLFIVASVLALLAIATIALAGLRSEALTIAVTVVLLASVSGVIAMLLPYATEIYPVTLRGTGSGVVAASSKAGGILGAGLGVLGFFTHFAWSALLLALPLALSAWLLLRSGLETRGQRLETIQASIRA